METRYLSVQWQEYQTLAQDLADAILSRKKSFDIIVAIARGGLSTGLMLSDFLNTPLASITIQSYTDIKKQGKLVITNKLGMQIKHKHVLLVDDIADSGKTFKRALSYIKSLKPASVTTAAIFYKPRSSYCPDFFAKKTNDWILLPHEVTEWITTFTVKMKKEGKSETEIQTFLRSLGYTDHQIAFVKKQYL